MGIFQKLINSRKKGRQLARAELLNGQTVAFTAWNGNAYANDIARGAIDSIARNISKLKGRHVVVYGDVRKPGTDTRLNRILQVQPNQYMNASDLLYKLATHYYLFNNAFAYIDKDERGNVVAVYPITCTQADFLSDASGEMFVQFRFKNGNTVVLPYADIVHLRRNYNSDELLGDDNGALYPALELAHTQNQGIVNGIKNGATIRGMLKYSNVLAPEVLKADKERFIADYLDVSNNGGIIATDNKAEYVPLENKPVNIDADQMKATATKIYDYLGISEKIVNSTYNEDEWGAFYESVIEPFSILLSLEFTRKIFNAREQAYGNQIVFDSGRVIYSNNQTRLNMIKELVPYGLLTVNEAREILNLAPVEDGDKRLQTLNVVQADKANEYQLDGNNNDDSKNGLSNEKKVNEV